LPEHFVNHVYVREAFEKGHPEFLVVLVPFILDSRSRRDALSRRERLNMKTLAACMLLLQLLWQETPEAADLGYSEKRGARHCALLWSSDLCYKIISNAFNESLFIVDQVAVSEKMPTRGGSLHALSTTGLEHFLGSLQRASNGDITAMNMDRLMRAALIERIACHQLGISSVVASRSRHEGAYVLPELGLPEDVCSLQEGLERAFAVYQLAYPRKDSRWPVELFGPLSDASYFATPAELLDYLPKPIDKSANGPLTTERDRMATMKALGPLVAARQWEKLTR
jgi:hypothetical protein